VVITTIDTMTHSILFIFWFLADNLSSGSLRTKECSGCLGLGAGKAAGTHPDFGVKPHQDG
jgi:hypothetical protein